MGNGVLTKREWLAIACAFDWCNSKIWQYIDKNHPYESYNLLLSKNTLHQDRNITRLKTLSSNLLDTMIDSCERSEISIITPSDEEYPPFLFSIKNSPAVLFVLGDTAALKSPLSGAIVGARECCEYTEEVTAYFASEFAANGVNVVSGFARGVDRAAHVAALKAGGTTTAVLGCGILYDYPKGTMQLKYEISKHGAVVSEYYLNAPPNKRNFPNRNRIITAISDFVLVTEASFNSGSLNSASHALTQGKPLFAVPPANIFSEEFLGQAQLIFDGAIPAMNAKNVLDYMRVSQNNKEEVFDNISFF
jgi:DNA processing protein